MAQLIVSSQELRQKKDTLAQLAGSLNKQISSLEQMGKSLNSMWDGDAKENFVRNLNVDLSKLKLFVKLVLEFVAILEKIIELYKIMEAKNVSTAANA